MLLVLFLPSSRLASLVRICFYSGTASMYPTSDDVFDISQFLNFEDSSFTSKTHVSGALFFSRLALN
jgi:hypothetical protein